LLEQILASHSQVDGTKELPDLLGIARRLGGKRRKSETSLYPAILADLSDEQFRELGEEYLQRTRIQRGDAPFFIDKMPNNFFHVGLISRMLPNATIIDARRHPMAAWPASAVLPSYSPEGSPLLTGWKISGAITGITWH
jgi:hypothetical protein